MSCCSTCNKHACVCGCGVVPGTPLLLYNRPGLSSLAYRVGTWADFRTTMQRNLSHAALPALAGLRTREADDPAMALLDTWAVGADVLTFYTERIANEGYLRTATERRSVLELARLVDYRLRPGVAASVYLAYDVDKNSPPVTIPAGAQAKSVPAPGEEMQTFETADPLEARYEWSALKPRLTRPQNISLDTIAGLDELWITGTATGLKPNDRLLFVFGDPATGVPAIRLVQSVDVQSQSNRSRVALQPMPSASVKLIEAANKAITALAYASTVDGRVPALEQVRRDILLGRTWDSFSQMKDSTMLGGLNTTLPGESAFERDAQAAFSNPSSGNGSSGGFRALFGALTLMPTLQPASRFRLQRSITSALGKASDVRPQLLMSIAPRLTDTFYDAYPNIPHGEPSPELTGVHAMRIATPLFGHNAPKTITLEQNPDADGNGTVTTTTSAELSLDEARNSVRLEGAHDGVLANSYLVIQPSTGIGVPAVVRVESVQVHPLTSYGISGKTTEIKLASQVAGNQPWAWPPPTMEALRTTQVYAQSEPLTLAELSITDTIGALADDNETPRTTTDGATRLTLDGAVDGLKASRWVIVEGRRSDVPGTDAVSAAELVMLAAVVQGVDETLPGDTVHSTLVFANKGLAYRYHRDSVTIHANVVRATQGETRHEVLGSGHGALPMQAFVLKQSPLTYVSAPTPSGVCSTLEVRVNDLRWHETRNLAFVGAAGRNFVTAIDNDGKTAVQFGDGAHGARLPTGVENVVATYRNGIGAPGNVDARQISLLTTTPLGVKDVINPLRASGGADPETRDQARRNVPLAVLALDRLVSVPDYEDFARTFGGVGKAVAIKLGNLVVVTIAGADDVPVDATSDLYRNLLEAMRRYGDPSLPVHLGVRELLALKLSAKVGLAPDYAWESVEPWLRAALLDAFGFERRALARNVYLSEVVACMQAVRGVAWVDMDAFGWFDEATLLAGFGVKGDNGNEVEVNAELQTTRTRSPYPSVPVLPARRDSLGVLRPAQLAYLLPAVPDTLLLQEATP